MYFTDTPTYLSDGSNKNIGRIRVQYDNIYSNKYGGICPDGFTADDADVVCGLIGTPTSG